MSTSLPSPQTSKAGDSPGSKLRQDTVAGLINATVSVPDGLASAALAGVNPVFGLYTSIAGSIGGSLLVSAQLMQVATTSASALVVRQALSRYPVGERQDALTVVLYVTSSASDVRVRALVRLENGRMSEADPPVRLPSQEITVLEVYGSLFFAGARTLLRELPSPAGASRPAVVLRLRGHTRIGATFIEVLDQYADDLAEVGGRVYLSGIDEDVSRQLRRAGKLDLDCTVQIIPQSAILGASTEGAVASASIWLGHARNNS